MSCLKSLTSTIELRNVLPVYKYGVKVPISVVENDQICHKYNLLRNHMVTNLNFNYGYGYFDHIYICW